MHYRRTFDPRERIRELRDARGFPSDRKLAEAAGVEQPTLSRYLSGKTKEMTVENFEALARALGVTLSELMGEVPLSSRVLLGEAEAVMRHLTDEQLRQVIDVARALFPRETGGPKPPADLGSR
jgi:transcriptional regulator with XRE-family HTH domain